MWSEFRKFLAENFALIWFGLSLMAIVFVAGMVVARWQVFPYTLLRDAKAGIEDWRENWEQNLEILPIKHLGPARAHVPSASFTTPQASPGVTLVSTFVKDDQINGPGLILLDMQGEILHKWGVPVTQIDPEFPGTDWDTLVTGAHLFPNGDVIFNFNDVAIVRLDVCSNVIWTAGHSAHHNIVLAEDGTIWTGGKDRQSSRILQTQYPRELSIKWPETIIQLSPDGALLQEIDVLDVILKSDIKGVLFANGLQRMYHTPFTDSNNFTHLNDTEILSAELADEYPLFDAGDILLSFRNLNLVAVIDGQDHRVKWYMVGAFVRQHDPDFIGGGLISVYDNMGAGPEDDIGFASRILTIDTNTNQVWTTYQADPPENFYTHERGGHQILPNGNMLITETFAGRIFEVTPTGDIVWNYVTSWDDETVIHPYQAERYEDPDGALAGLSCAG